MHQGKGSIYTYWDLSDQAKRSSLNYSDSEDPPVMGDYSNQTQAEILAIVNRIFVRTVRTRTVSRGVDDTLTTHWFKCIYSNLTEAHISTLSEIEKKWTSTNMDQRLELTQGYRNVIEDVRPAESIVDESDGYDWAWTEMNSGCGSLYNLIFMIMKKETARSAHLHEPNSAAEWPGNFVEGKADASAFFSGRFNIDWLTNLAFFARRYHHDIDDMLRIAAFLKIICNTGALSEAKVLSCKGCYPALMEMSKQWIGDGNTLRMCPVVMTFQRFTLAMSLLSGYPSELTALRTINDLGSLDNLIDQVFFNLGGLDSLSLCPLDTSMAECMLKRALILGPTTDPAKFVRTGSNVLAIMRHMTA